MQNILKVWITIRKIRRNGNKLSLFKIQKIRKHTQHTLTLNHEQVRINTERTLV